MNFNQAMIRRALFLVGLVLYVASFSIISAISGPGGEQPLLGYEVAIEAYLGGIATLDVVFAWRDSHINILAMLPTMAVLLINPVFFVAVWRILFRRPDRVFLALFLLLVGLLPCCWVLLPAQDLIPQSGFYIWIASMLLTLASAPTFNPPTQPEPSSTPVT
jgi:hypothetical protein